MLKCQISTDNDHGSDHLPIETVLDLFTPPPPPTEPAYNYEKTKWKLLKTKLKEYLPQTIDPDCTTPTQLDQFTIDLTNAIKQAIDETTPRKRPSPFSKRWWNDELTELRRDTSRRRRTWHRTRNYMDRDDYLNKRSEYYHEIKKAKRKTWRSFVEKADEKTIWTLKKYMDSTPIPRYIPTINNATSNEDKAAAFKSTFFPPPPLANLSDIPSTYPDPVPCNSKITTRQLENAINKLSPNKAPGPDEISNLVLKKTFHITQDHLLALMQATININHFPTPFKTTTTVILRKPSKPDYTKPNSYRPIALENTLGKVLESIMAELLSYVTETHQLLPPEHFGGRPGRTAEDAMTILSERIQHAWKEKEIYSAVFMDVAGAFNNVHHERLIDNMEKRRIPGFIIA